ncbi:Rieske Fe-S protein [Natronocella acetinitrilica]|uniref:Rieske Fe-S protein n=1 Tax=Natronocella acetinitrilica TaxID=414046 RepID=A0AAE3KF05_9GAMM|nr:hypothetical protein [Natronocella acetinitrilica]MCP1673627.1 Rieske Fe-S protein [Natronocella acetinitrilica]
MKRRSFIQACGVGAGCVAVAGGLAQAAGNGELRPRHYERVRLLGHDGSPLLASTLPDKQQYVFPYPYAATPCFLINLGEPMPPRNGLKTADGEPYSWPGGVGPRRQLVAYSAICAHKLAHPTPTLSYISFRQARNGDEPESGVISCCAENSLYNPSQGAEVISGPARQPLASIIMEHDDETDELFAVGTLGGELFDRFFSDFEARLSLEYPDGNGAKPLTGEVTALTLADYTNNIMRC